PRFIGRRLWRSAKCKKRREQILLSPGPKKPLRSTAPAMTDAAVGCWRWCWLVCNPHDRRMCFMGRCCRDEQREHHSGRGEQSHEQHTNFFHIAPPRSGCDRNLVQFVRRCLIWREFQKVPCPCLTWHNSTKLNVKPSAHSSIAPLARAAQKKRLRAAPA